mgnify:CR=1 FL=1
MMFLKRRLNTWYFAESAVYAPVLEFSIYIRISLDKAWIGIYSSQSVISLVRFILLFSLFIIHVISKSKLML